MSGGDDEQLCRAAVAQSSGVDPDGAGWCGGRVARRLTAHDDLDDDHTAAAAWTPRLVGVGDGLGGRILTFFDDEQLAGACDVAGTGAPRQQVGMADAVEALWQHVDEEAHAIPKIALAPLFKAEQGSRQEPSNK
jgi:hypothetical protein